MTSFFSILFAVIVFIPLLLGRIFQSVTYTLARWLMGKKDAEVIEPELPVEPKVSLPTVRVDF
jgi:hypothetical protein